MFEYIGFSFTHETFLKGTGKHTQKIRYHQYIKYAFIVQYLRRKCCEIWGYLTMIYKFYSISKVRGRFLNQHYRVLTKTIFWFRDFFCKYGNVSVILKVVFRYVGTFRQPTTHYYVSGSKPTF